MANSELDMSVEVQNCWTLPSRLLIITDLNQIVIDQLADRSIDPMVAW